MKRLTVIIFTLLSLVSSAAPLDSNLKEALKCLDRHIERRDDYVQQKLSRIQAIRDEFKNAAPER